ncbi:runt-related transcription factor 1 [Caerostris darwini]|uniref:Runt-related transcription factor 1 n=1 Tax=Caerostris darwini TaxID=1538125 RepID=A0AAV4SFB7_9ARAC|nr:runt-related transcription factor 1 [Caerostris darwini]
MTSRTFNTTQKRLITCRLQIQQRISLLFLPTCLGGQQYHLRAFASAFGHRPPFLDPRLVDPLREWEHMRRKSEWAMDTMAMRIPGGPHAAFHLLIRLHVSGFELESLNSKPQSNFYQVTSAPLTEDNIDVLKIFGFMRIL